jgi:acetyl esterase/lipase
MLTRSTVWIFSAALALGSAAMAIPGSSPTTMPAATAPLSPIDRAESEAATRPGSNALVKLDFMAVTAKDSVVHKDIAYVADRSDQQKLDVYAPADAHGATTVIYVHGGEWTKGDKSQVAYKPKFFNEQGMVFVSVNYRLSGVAKHPAQVEDIAAAVRYVHDHAADFGADPHKLVLMGHSAGCHLVALIGLDPRILGKVGMQPTDLAAVVSWSGGAFDLAEKVAQGGMYAKYIHINFGNDEQVWHDASPVAHVGDAKTPPILFVSAEHDNTSSIIASKRLTGLVKNAGGSTQWIELPGKTHGTADHDLGAPGDETGKALLEFIFGATH